MYTCPFDEFHNAREKYIAAVADSIDFNLFSEYVFIYQYRFVFVYLHCSLEVLSELGFVADNLHRSPSKNE